jgi:hypothetical protein
MFLILVYLGVRDTKRAQELVTKTLLEQNTKMQEMLSQCQRTNHG